jgi:uncharacterized protein YcaQ
VTLEDLRHAAVARTLFPPTTLKRAFDRLGFVQADPIRAPARAQDLTLRHRVAGYRAGDLERRYPRLAIEEDCLVNYGFLPRRHLALMHPRIARKVWDEATREKAAAMLAFIRERGPTHPRVVQAAFAHGRITNYWGGSSLATTHLLDGMHYRGQLRVARRENGIRIYQAVEHPPAEDDAEARGRRAAELVELVIRKYAPLPRPSFGYLVSLLGYGAPHLRTEARAVVAKAREHLASTEIDGVTWYWPADENPRSARWRPDEAVRFLAPFDPIVWDRRRFELLWGWTYRFEAYTPAAKRKLGYYALPMLFGDRIVGWGNASVVADRLEIDTGFVDKPVASRRFRDGFYEERERMSAFLGL